jgi:hypothetical protein
MARVARKSTEKTAVVDWLMQNKWGVYGDARDGDMWRDLTASKVRRRLMKLSMQTLIQENVNEVMWTRFQAGQQVVRARQAELARRPRLSPAILEAARHYRWCQRTPWSPSS